MAARSNTRPKVTYEAMWAKPKKDGGTYWLKVGIAYLSDKGRIHLNIESVPVGFDGKIICFPQDPVKTSEGVRASTSPGAAGAAAAAQELASNSGPGPGETPAQAVNEFDDDLPF